MTALSQLMGSFVAVFVKTLFENYKRKAGRLVGWEFEDLATDDIFYDE
jgi:hypothetical protein